MQVALLNVKFLATSVMMQMRFLVFLPESAAKDEDKECLEGKFRVLWLLHPEGGDCSDWIRLSLAEAYAQEANIALVMPSMDNSMYMDMAHGKYPYFTYLSDDLPNHVRNLLPVLSRRRCDNFAAGISTGGYGAVKWALREPDMFEGVACLSGQTDMLGFLQEKEGCLAKDWEIAFGGAAQLKNTQDDTLALFERAAAENREMFSIYIASARGEEVFERSKQTAEKLRNMNFPVTFEEGSEGGWLFWNEQIKRYIRHIGEGGKGHVKG